MGDEITLSGVSGSESNWEIVGINYDPIANTAIFVPRTILQRDLGQIGTANTIFIQTQDPDGLAMQSTALRLSDTFERRNFSVATSGPFGYNTIAEITEETQGGYSLIFQLLAIMAVIIAVVGGWD